MLAHAHGVIIGARYVGKNVYSRKKRIQFWAEKVLILIIGLLLGVMACLVLVQKYWFKNIRRYQR